MVAECERYAVKDHEELLKADLRIETDCFHDLHEETSHLSNTAVVIRIITMWIDKNPRHIKRQLHDLEGKSQRYKREPPDDQWWANHTYAFCLFTFIFVSVHLHTKVVVKWVLEMESILFFLSLSPLNICLRSYSACQAGSKRNRVHVFGCRSNCLCPI